jgi:hypothetical protein
MAAGRISRKLWWTNQEFPFVDIIPPWFHAYIITRGMKNRPVGGPSSET